LIPSLFINSGADRPNNNNNNNKGLEGFWAGKYSPFLTLPLHRLDYTNGGTELVSMAAAFSILRPEFALPFPFLSVFFSFLKKAAFGRGLGAGTNGYHGDFDLAPPKRIEGKSQGGPHTQRHIL
jgi:hypothetical protein